MHNFFVSGRFRRGLGENEGGSCKKDHNDDVRTLKMSKSETFVRKSHGVW